MSNGDLLYWENTACCQIWCTVLLPSFPFSTIRRTLHHSYWVHPAVFISFPPQSPRKFLLCQHTENWLHSFSVCLWNLQSNYSMQLKMHEIFFFRNTSPQTPPYLHTLVISCPTPFRGSLLLVYSIIHLISILYCSSMTHCQYHTFVSQ